MIPEDRSWKVRYFVLEHSSELDYYEDSSRQRKLGSIPLAAAHLRETSFLGVSKYFAFEIDAGGRQYILGAPGETEHRAWTKVSPTDRRPFAAVSACQPTNSS